MTLYAVSQDGFPMTMLDRMRRHKGWLKWSLALIVLAFVLAYIPSYLQPDPSTVGAAPNEVIATVDRREITAGEFQQRYTAQIQAYQQQLGSAANLQLLRQLGIENQILTQLIDEQVALIEAARHGIAVSDEELAQQIFAIPALQENGRFVGEQRYELLLRSQRPPLTKRQFEEGLRRDLVIGKLRAALTDWMTVPDAEVEREYRERNEKVKLQVVALTAGQFRERVTVTDAEVAAYFEAHRAEYRIGEQRQIRYLLLDRDEARRRVLVPPADVDRYYNQNIQMYQSPEQVRASHILLQTAGKDEAAVRAQAEAILAEVKAGGDFAALARKYSEDEGSKAGGGDLNYFGRGQMVPEFEQAAFALEPGQVSELVRSQFGFHIIKVVDKRAAVTRPLEEVRAQIEDQLAWQTANDQISQRADQLASRLRNPSDLDVAAGELGVAVQQSGFFQRQDPVPGLGVAPQVASTAFTLELNRMSPATTSPRGPVFFVVTERRDPYVPMLDEVRDRVREDAILARARELSRERASELAAALKSAPDFAAAARRLGVEVKETDLVTRESPIPDVGISPEVDAAAFALPVGGVSDPIATSQGTVIVRVLERDEVTPDEFRIAREAFRAELLAERRGRFFTAYMQKVKDRLAIETRTDVLRRAVAAYQL